MRRQILSHDDGIMLVRVAFEAGAIGPRHSHPHVRCTLVESGVFDVTIAGETRRLGPGDSFLVPTGAVHGVVTIEAGALTDVLTPMREDFVA